VDTAGFLGHVLSLLARLWTRGLQHHGEQSAPILFLSSMRELILVMVEHLGLLPFTARPLFMDERNIFVPISTSYRSGKNHGVSRLPLHHLFSILSSLPSGVPDDDAFAEFTRSVFDPFFSAKAQNGRVELAQEVLQSMPMDTLCPYGPWLLASESIAAGLEAAQSSNLSSFSGSETPAGHEYRDIVRVLERGLRSIPNLPWIHWQGLFCSLSDRLRDETGDAGLALCVIEPLAKIILELKTQNVPSSVNSNKAIIELLSVSVHTRDRQAVDAAKRRLWGSAISGSRSASFDPFDSLYKLVDSSLAHFYDDFDNYDSDEIIVQFLKEVGSFLARCNPQLVIRTLVALQEGISHWIRDEKVRINSRRSPAIVEAVSTTRESPEIDLTFVRRSSCGIGPVRS
jgi:hypothetical protein